MLLPWLLTLIWLLAVTWLLALLVGVLLALALASTLASTLAELVLIWTHLWFFSDLEMERTFSHKLTAIRGTGSL